MKRVASYVVWFLAFLWTVEAIHLYGVAPPPPTSIYADVNQTMIGVHAAIYLMYWIVGAGPLALLAKYLGRKAKAA